MVNWFIHSYWKFAISRPNKIYKLVLHILSCRLYCMTFTLCLKCLTYLQWCEPQHFLFPFGEVFRKFAGSKSAVVLQVFLIRLQGFLQLLDWVGKIPQLQMVHVWLELTLKFLTKIVIISQTFSFSWLNIPNLQLQSMTALILISK